MQEYNNPILIQPTGEIPRKIGIIDAGTIGPDIGYYLKSAIPDLSLVLMDISREALHRADDTARKLKDARHEPGSAKGNNSGHP